MATITRRGDLQWQAKVRRKGFPVQTRTFTYREDAEKWARALERELETTGFVDRREADRTTLREVLERYRQEVTPSKKCAAIESVKIDVILKDPVLAKLKLTAINGSAIAAWRDRRLKDVTGGTVNREIDVLSAVFNHAKREWGLHVENPIPQVKRPEKSRARDRRLSALEEQYLFAAFKAQERRADGALASGARNPFLAPAVALAIETAMRRGELLALLWAHVNLERRTAFLPETKNGDQRTVPLSSKAVSILTELKGIARNEKVFPMTAASLQKGFWRAMERARKQYFGDCHAAGRQPEASFLVDIHFHDTRHEAASRLADKLPNVLELSAVTGHRDLRMLKRYYHPRAEDIAKKLD
jgi:integrase